MEAKELAEAIGDFCNGARAEHMEELAQHLTQKVHRTLQQRAAELFLTCFSEWNKRGEEDNYDRRNEATVKAGWKIMQAMDGFHRLPFI